MSIIAVKYYLMPGSSDICTKGQIPIRVSQNPLVHTLLHPFLHLHLAQRGPSKPISRKVQTHGERRTTTLQPPHHNNSQSAYDNSHTAHNNTTHNIISRTRRISSSTAAKRFPKDFFAFDNRGLLARGEKE